MVGVPRCCSIGRCPEVLLQALFFVRDFRAADGAQLTETTTFQGRLVKAKSRLAAQGHKDPDLFRKLEAAKLSSPTLGHDTLMVGLQVVANEKFMRSLTQFNHILTLKRRRMSFTATIVNPNQG